MSKNLLNDLKRVIDLKGSAYVAVLLGYKDGMVVKQWIRRKSIPNWQVKRVESLLKKELKG